MGLAFGLTNDYHLTIKEKFQNWLGSGKWRDFIAWFLVLFLGGVTVYRACVMSPRWIDGYLLYLPELFFLVVFIILLLFSRRTALSAVRVVLAAVLLFGWLMPIELNLSREEEKSLRLVSLNVQSYATDLDSAMHQVVVADPEFILLQELWSRSGFEVVAGVLGAAGYRIEGKALHDDLDRSKFNEGTFVAIRGEWDFVEQEMGEDSAVVKISKGGQELVLVSHHGPKKGGYSPGSVLGTAEEQVQVSEDLLRILEAMKAPSVVGGDFNAPESGPAFKVLKSRFHQAFREAGHGFGLTFPSVFPIIRIDHILGSPEIRFVNFQRENFGSDHLGVLVDFVVIQ